MYKIIFLLLILFTPITNFLCQSKGYQKSIIQDNTLFCYYQEKQLDGTIMTAKIRLISVLTNPELWQNWIESFDKIPEHEV